MNNRTIAAVIGFASMFAFAGVARAQSSNLNMAVQITNARKANATLMRQYTWNSRTEIIEGGQVKDIRIELVNYAPNGQLQRSLINDQGSRMPLGFLRRAIAEARRKRLEDYLTGLRGLIEQYTLPTTGKILDFMNRATTSGPDASGLFQMTGSSVVVPGDSFTVWTDARTRQTRRVQVNTFFQGDMVTVTATFETIPSGLTYMSYREADIGAKQLSVQVQNFSYTRPN
jgi:hypothetical protein